MGTFGIFCTKKGTKKSNNMEKRVQQIVQNLIFYKKTKRKGKYQQSHIK